MMVGMKRENISVSYNVLVRYGSNEEGHYVARCLHCNEVVAKGSRDDPAHAVRADALTAIHWCALKVER